MIIYVYPRTNKAKERERERKKTNMIVVISTNHRMWKSKRINNECKVQLHFNSRERKRDREKLVAHT